MQRFAHALKTMRHDLGMSQLDLAHHIDTTQRHISFLETGRSKPSRDFVIRLATGLTLSLPQRAALFDAGGFDNPYRRTDFGADEMRDVLDLLDNRLLRHWPFAGFVLDESWNVLRANAPGRAMLGEYSASENAPVSMYEVFLSPAFQERLLNWEEVSTIFYFRMQEAAAHAPALARGLERAKAAGMFDHITDQARHPDVAPPYVPAELMGPNGQVLRMSSLVGKLASVHDAAVDGLEVELLVPMDDATESCLLGG